MPISVICPTCEKPLKAPDRLAGRQAICPQCKARVQIPAAEDDAADFLLSENAAPSVSPGPPPLPERPQSKTTPTPAPIRPRPAAVQSFKKDNLATLPPLRMQETPTWLRHLHWLLVLALIPLAVILLVDRTGNDFVSRLLDGLENAEPDVKDKFNRLLPSEDNGAQGKGGNKKTTRPVQKKEEAAPSIDQMIGVFPGNRLPNAFLARDSLLHWGFALVAAVLFLAFLLFLAIDGSAQMGHMLGVALFTATVGIFFLFVVQWLAEWSQRYYMTGASIVTLLFYIVKFIGFSYQAALDPDHGFLSSFFGYTFGVGLCEEVVKALPLFWYYRQPNGQSWRGAFLWGLACGAGFGIAEGIMYSSRFYNGISGLEDYVVRFISCVALHALWTGSVGITLHQRQEMFQKENAWYEYIPIVILIVGVPMVLHGLYDTLLKKDMNAGALVVALLSFAFLAFQISRLRGADDDEAKDAMLKEYQRRRAAMGRV